MSSEIQVTSDLWIRLQNGDARAFTDLYRIHAQRVYNHCYRRTLSYPDSEDLTAEVFVATWRKRTQIRLHDEAGGLPWLLMTANNLLHRRRASLTSAAKLLSRLPVDHIVPDHGQMLADQAGIDHDMAVIAVVLKRLSRRDRDIVQLCVVEQIASTQLAAVTGEPAGTIRSRLSRALVKARNEYDQLTAANLSFEQLRNML